MVGIGTLVNTIVVFVGGSLGLLFGDKLKDNYKKMLIDIMGVSLIIIGLSGTLSGMFVLDGNKVTAEGSIYMVLILSIGSIIGEILDLESGFEKIGRWLKNHVKGGDHASYFIEGFVTTSITISIGAMAIVGPIQEGLNNDPSLLYTKSILDGIIVFVFASTFGSGAIFSAVSIFVIQGSITLFSSLIAPVFTDMIIFDIAYIGSVLIFCVGINLLLDKKIRVTNMLPSLLLVIIYGSIFK